MNEHQQAFPHTDNGIQNETYHSGMTLLDYFAAKAMNGLLCQWDHINGSPYRNFTEMSGDAYQMALCMMEERKKHIK